MEENEVDVIVEIEREVVGEGIDAQGIHPTSEEMLRQIAQEKGYDIGELKIETRGADVIEASDGDLSVPYQIIREKRIEKVREIQRKVIFEDYEGAGLPTAEEMRERKAEELGINKDELEILWSGAEGDQYEDSPVTPYKIVRKTIIEKVKEDSKEEPKDVADEIKKLEEQATRNSAEMNEYSATLEFSDSLTPEDKIDLNEAIKRLREENEEIAERIKKLKVKQESKPSQNKKEENILESNDEQEIPQVTSLLAQMAKNKEDIVAYEARLNFSGYLDIEAKMQIRRFIAELQRKNEEIEQEIEKLRGNEQQSKPEQKTEPTTEQKTNPTTEQKTNLTTEQKIEQKTNPTTEPTTEQKTNPTTEQKTNPTTEQKTEQKTNPTTEPKTEPTAETKIEPKTEQKTEKVTEQANMQQILDRLEECDNVFLSENEFLYQVLSVIKDMKGMKLSLEEAEKLSDTLYRIGCLDWEAWQEKNLDANNLTLGQLRGSNEAAKIISQFLRDGKNDRSVESLNIYLEHLDDNNRITECLEKIQKLIKEEEEQNREMVESLNDPNDLEEEDNVIKEFLDANTSALVKIDGVKAYSEMGIMQKYQMKLAAYKYENPDKKINLFRKIGLWLPNPKYKESTEKYLSDGTIMVDIANQPTSEVVLKEGEIEIPEEAYSYENALDGQTPVLPDENVVQNTKVEDEVEVADVDLGEDFWNQFRVAQTPTVNQKSSNSQDGTKNNRAREDDDVQSL